MSGFCAVLALDGGTVDAQLVDTLAKTILSRGPDGNSTWHGGSVVLGHALLRTDPTATGDQQPRAMEGIWITADARIDGQKALRRDLQSAGRAVAAMASDADLILHAYLAWGDDCVRHLIGDFAFVIWDSRHRTFFAARDHYGVKQFFYAQVGNHFVVSNAIDAVRAHPMVSSRLNDLAVADFLLFDYNQDPATSFFSDIRRLRPAHCLRSHAGSVEIRRYWEMPRDLAIRYRSGADYVDHFREILRAAVTDRMRAPRVSLQMSGGMDSTTVAAMAKAIADSRPHGCELRAHAIVYDRLIPDNERRFATLAAQALGIPIVFLVGDDYRLFDSEAKPFRPGEPFHSPDHALLSDAAALEAEFSPVVLTGWDGDSLLSESPRPFLRHLLARHQYGSALSVIVGYARLHRRLIPKAWMTRLTSAGQIRPLQYPDWLSPVLEERLDLRDRWQECMGSQGPAHPLRPYGYRMLARLENSSYFFAMFDSAVTGQNVEYRHPLLDIRVIEFCLSLPPWPWCDSKQLLRRSMAGILPRAVLKRPKTGLNGYPYLERLRDPQVHWPRVEDAETSIYNYVNADSIRSTWTRPRLDPQSTWAELRVLSLNQWMRISGAKPG